MEQATIAARIEEFGITSTFKVSDRAIPKGFPSGTNAYSVTLRSSKTRRQWTVPFFTGPAITSDPSSEDVLNCLMLDAGIYVNAAGSVHNFLDEFGYEDTTEYRNIYKACGRTYDRIIKFLGSVGNAHAMIFETESL